ncbi:hypothetical protein [Nostoc sp.]
MQIRCILAYDNYIYILVACQSCFDESWNITQFVTQTGFLQL